MKKYREIYRYSLATQQYRQPFVGRRDAFRRVRLTRVQLQYPRLLGQLLEVFLADLVRFEQFEIELGELRAERGREKSAGQYERVDAVEEAEGETPEHRVQRAYRDPCPQGGQHEPGREKGAKRQHRSLERARHQERRCEEQIRRLVKGKSKQRFPREKIHRPSKFERPSLSVFRPPFLLLLPPPLHLSPEKETDIELEM